MEPKSLAVVTLVLFGPGLNACTKGNRQDFITYEQCVEAGEKALELRLVEEFVCKGVHSGQN